MAIIRSGASTDQLTIDVTSKAARASLYDSAGNTIDKTDKLASGLTPGTTKGLLMIGGDYKTPRIQRVRPDGSFPDGSSLCFHDPIEGATINSIAWTNTNTTQTAVQASGIITLNNSAITTTTTGCLLLSNKSFEILSRGRLIFRTRQRHTTHGTNHLIELGFGTTTSATVAGIGTGACWRKDGTGQYIPVVSTVNGTETLGTPISNATWTASIGVNDYGIFEVELEQSQAVFRAYTSVGVLVNEQIVDLTSTTTNWQATHVQAIVREYFSGAGGAATQVLMGTTSVWTSDYEQDKPWSHVQSSYGRNSLASPTAYTQLANAANSTDGTARTLSNTAAAEATLGGYVKANSIAGSTTADLILIGWTNPSPYNFHFTGIRIGVPINQVVAVATTATTFAYYGMSINNTAPTNLSTGTHFRVTLGGFHTAAIAVAANVAFTGTEVVWQPQTPMVVTPGRGLTVFTREIVGTATATETYQWSIVIDGYFD